MSSKISKTSEKWDFEGKFRSQIVINMKRSKCVPSIYWSKYNTIKEFTASIKEYLEEMEVEDWGK